jgi:hypothetical protein
MEISPPWKDKRMGPRELTRLKDITTTSTEEVKTSKRVGLRPWESDPYKYEEQKSPKKSSLRNPRQDYVEQAHGQHQDDFLPSDGSHRYSPSAFGVTTDRYASTAFADDQGTLAGTAKHAKEFYNRLNSADQSLLDQAQNNNTAASSRGRRLLTLWEREYRRRADESTPSPGVGH